MNTLLRIFYRLTRMKHVAEIVDVTGPTDTWPHYVGTGRRAVEMRGARVTPWRGGKA